MRQPIYLEIRGRTGEFDSLSQSGFARRFKSSKIWDTIIVDEVIIFAYGFIVSLHTASQLLVREKGQLM